MKKDIKALADKSSSKDKGTETPGSDTGDSSPILIKKYPNRRLYNTSTSAYIVLDDIVELVKSDTPFIIQDKKTGEDITRQILNQIIFEQEVKPGHSHFSLEVQKQLISMYGDTYGAMIPDYLKNSMELFVSERERMSEAVENVMGRNTEAMMEFSRNMARQNMELFKRSWEMFGGMAPAKPTEKKSAEGAEKTSQKMIRPDELKEIQRKIDALQDRLKALK